MSYVAQSYGCDFSGNKRWQAQRAMGEALLSLLSRGQQSCYMLYNLRNASLHSIITIRKVACIVAEYKEKGNCIFAKLWTRKMQIHADEEMVLPIGNGCKMSAVQVNWCR